METKIKNKTRNQQKKKKKKKTYYNQWKIVTPLLLKIPFIVLTHCQNT